MIPKSPIAFVKTLLHSASQQVTDDKKVGVAIAACTLVTERALDTAAKKCRGLDSAVLMAAYVESGEAERQGHASKSHAAIFEETMRRLKEEKNSLIRRTESMLGRQKTRRAAVGENAITQALVAGGKKNKRAYNERTVGVDCSNLMDWTLSPIQSLKLAIKCMYMMFLTVAMLFGAALWPVLTVQRRILEVQTISTGLNSTNLNSTLVYDPAPNNRAAGTILLAIAGVTTTASYILIGLFLNMRSRRTYFLMWTPFVIAMVTVVLLYEYGGDHISGKRLGLALASVGCGSAGIIGYVFFSESDDDNGRSPYSLAVKRASTRLLKGKEYGGRTTKQKVIAGMLITIPGFFTYGVQIIMILAVFWLFRAGDSTEWKVFVTMLALGIKVAGNKGMLLLVGKLAPWIVDINLYNYEFSTALLFRLLQLSIPDESTAQMVTVVGSVVEVCVRLYFFTAFVKAGMKNTAMSKKEELKYAKWGKLRVQDGNNDMIVEYMSSLVAGLFMIYLAPLRAFNFATTERIPTARIVTLCAYQIVPEIILDFFVLFVEINCGLGKLHGSYWEMRTGGEPSSRFAVNRMGDLPKSTVLKLVITPALMCFALLVVLK
jgi:hypothetical protein